MPKQIIHGVFLNISAVGTLITGKPGIGKSELALALITRGHQLIADDAVYITGTSPSLIGSCPELLQGFLEVKDLGFLNIKTLFGEQAIKPQAELQIVINLADDEPKENNNYIEILNTKIPQITIIDSASRNCELLTEIAIRNFLTKKQGNDANIELATKQKQLLQRENI